MKYFALIITSIFLKACLGPHPFQDGPSQNTLLPLGQSLSQQQLVARNDDAGSLSLGLEWSGSNDRKCLTVDTHADFLLALRDLQTDDLVDSGLAYDCLIDGDTTLPSCFNPANATDFVTDFHSLISTGSFTEGGNSYSCVDASALAPLSCFVASNAIDYQAAALAIQSSPGTPVNIGGVDYSCVTADY